MSRTTEQPALDDALSARADALLREPEVAVSLEHLRATDERTLADQQSLTEIPAPPFGEEARGRRMATLMEEAGLEEVRTDREGNVLGWVPGSRGGAAAGDGRPLVLAAHLDTVFPTSTDVRVARDGDRLAGPGISDDGRGLAALLALARTLKGPGAALRLPAPLLLVATVGEEGPGDLRGVRHRFRDGGPGRAARGFVSLDGAGTERIVTGALGSRRYRIAARGAGGHSWVNWGVANPIHALGRLVAELAALPLPETPATTLTVARWSGGTAINAIPEDAWVEVDVRSRDPQPLEALDRKVRERAAAAVEAVNAAAAAGTPHLRLVVEGVGHRPAGRTPPEAGLVRAAVAATRALGGAPELTTSSTDANIPMALGMPALTMGAGGEAGQAHTTQEWYRNTQGPEGIFRALLTVLLLGEAGG